jgi:hypothetical protein
MDGPSCDGWLLTVKVWLTDPLTAAQRFALEEVLLSVDETPGASLAWLQIAVHAPALPLAVDGALRSARHALVSVDAWFERVDLVNVVWPATSSRPASLGPRAE